MKRFLLVFFLFTVSIVSKSQITWNGMGDGVSWSDAANWVGNVAPTSIDNVLLDNSVIPGSYSVNLPGGGVTVSVFSLTITPAGINNITLTLPSTNTAAPGLEILDVGESLVLNAGAILKNSSGLTGASLSIGIGDLFRISDGGHYIHNTTSQNTNIANKLSTGPGTELGEFEYDVPSISSIISLAGRNYGTLTLNAIANPTPTYNGSGALDCNVRGNLNINANVTFSLSMSANFIVAGDYNQAATSTFDLQSAGSNNFVKLRGDLTIGGVITVYGGGLPTLELNGTSNQSITVTGSGSIINNVRFKMNNPTGATLNDPLILPYTLELTSGRITTTLTDILTMVDNGTYTGGSATSFIDGPMKKIGDDDFTFPVGKGGMYAPIGMFGGVGATILDEFVAEYIRSNPQNDYGINYAPGGTNPDIDHISFVEYWDLDQVIGFTTKQIMLTVHAQSFCKLLGNTYIAQSTGNTNPWITLETSISTGPNPCGPGLECGTLVTDIATIILGEPFTLYSDVPFAINPLPIKLISFNAVKVNSGLSNLVWELAACCSDAAKFEVQKSTDGRNYSTFTIIPGSLTNRFYTVNDSRLGKGVTYYRLKMIEPDGSVLYSKIVAIINESNAILISSLAPNPVQNKAMLTVSSGRNASVDFKVYNMSGSLVKQWQSNVTEGNNTIEVDLSRLSSGIYSIFASANGSTTVSRFVKQ